MFTNEEIQSLIDASGFNCAIFLEKLGALYRRPRRGLDPIGPLVGRESTYKIEGNPGVSYNWVSENYYNGQVIKSYPLAIAFLAQLLLIEIKKKYLPLKVEFWGVGQNGELLAEELRKQSKVIIQTENSSDTEEEFNRVALVQDILEPLTLREGILLAKKENKNIAYVCSIINPDKGYDGYLPINSQGPVSLVSLIKELLMKYKQDHPLVAEDVAEGNIVWDPKNEWDKLAKVMSEAYDIGLLVSQNRSTIKLNVDNERAKEILVI